MVLGQICRIKDKQLLNVLEMVQGDDLVEDQQDDIAILENALQMIDVSYLFTTSFYYKAP